MRPRYLSDAAAKTPSFAISCPACHGTVTVVLRRHPVYLAAEHFVPFRRDPVRNQRLRSHLETLWGRDSVEIRRCRNCCFVFPEPCLAGDMEFYEIVYGGKAHYPRSRWEFHKTLTALEEAYGGDSRGQIRLLECGAGDGRFLRLVQRSAIGSGTRLTATEFDQVALHRLAALGVVTRRSDVLELAEDPELQGSFDVICMFHVLEHMSAIDRVFESLRALTTAGGMIFVSVPNGLNVDQQETVTGFWEMPPAHVGRWYLESLKRIAARHGLKIAQHEIEPSSQLAELWRLAVYRVGALCYSQNGLAPRVNALPRPVRGPLKRLLATKEAIGLAPNLGSLSGQTQWLQLQK